MSSAISGSSYPPQLRSRASASATHQSRADRLRHLSPPGRPDLDQSDFIDFLHRIATLAAKPYVPTLPPNSLLREERGALADLIRITVPLELIKKALTSPLTISLVLKLALLGFLVLASAVFSVLAVGAFWWSWGTGGVVEAEGWLTYGSKIHRTPHAMVPLDIARFQEDLRYDVEVEMELVRPNKASEEIGNFMLSLELRSQRNPETVLISAAQPSLPPPPLLISYLPINPIPCLIPWPFRFACPSRLLGRSSASSTRKVARRKRKGSTTAQFRASDIVLLSKQLMEAVVMVPSNTNNLVVGSAFVSIGREDTFTDSTEKCTTSPKEVRTTGWVSLRFTPRPTGIRWLLSSHPLPPLLLLPPISLTLTLSSSLLAFLIISYVSRSPRDKSKSKISPSPETRTKTMEEKLLDERRAAAERDAEDRREEERLRAEWEDEQERHGSGLQRIPEGIKRSRVGESTIGGSETTIRSGPSEMPSFSFQPASEDGITSESSVTDGEITEREGGRRGSDSDESGSGGWVEAR